MFRAREIGLEMGLSGPADCILIIQYMLRKPLDFDPGSRFAYSNFGYCVLGRVIEEISGLGYEEYVLSHILEPTGITTMQLGSTKSTDRLAGEVHYYATETSTQSIFGEEGEQAPWPYGGFSLETMDANGGWVASAKDLALFASALEGDGGKSLLEPETLALILSPSETYSYGWKVRPAGKGLNWWATGSMPGTTAILYCRSDGLIWAALFNANPDHSSDIFLVEVITEIGKAALMAKITTGGSVILLLLIVATSFLILRKRKKSLRFYSGISFILAIGCYLNFSFV